MVSVLVKNNNGFCFSPISLFLNSRFSRKIEKILLERATVLARICSRIGW